MRAVSLRSLSLPPCGRCNVLGTKQRMQVRAGRSKWAPGREQHTPCGRRAPSWEASRQPTNPVFFNTPFPQQWGAVVPVLWNVCRECPSWCHRKPRVARAAAKSCSQVPHGLRRLEEEGRWRRDHLRRPHRRGGLAGAACRPGEGQGAAAAPDGIRRTQGSSNNGGGGAGRRRGARRAALREISGEGAPLRPRVAPLQHAI